MKIAIFGLGYVGAVSAGCLAKLGHTVIGVDQNKVKVDLINAGHTPVIEKDLDTLISEAVRSGLLRATTVPDEALESSDVSLVCVGTPSQPNGNLDLKYVRAVCREIGTALPRSANRHVVVMRSTMLPGSMGSVVIPELERASGRRAGEDFEVCINPEFLREATAIYDFFHPPKTVIGEMGTRGGDVVAALYKGIDAPLIRTAIETAEMVKYTDNVWHALKVGFANEIGTICKAVGIDGREVMEVFCRDLKLNIAPTYLKPGYAFGGSCLPKDVRALTYRARSLDLNVPILNAILPSNEQQIARAFRMIMDRPSRKVGLLGLSFKAGTDDLRESPLVELAERLIGKGCEVLVYDRNVQLASLVGANRDYILNHIPHIARLLRDRIGDVLGSSDTVIIGNGAAEFQDVPSRLRPGQALIDLVHLDSGSATASGSQYEGICW